MPARIRHLTVDCQDPYPLARFWSSVLGFTDDPENPNHPDDSEALIIDPAGHHPGMLFLPVPEEKAGKNRIHLDLQPTIPRDAAVDEIVSLGGTIVADHRTGEGLGWVVLADPEGNEFCVERSAAERDDHPTPLATGDRETPPIHTADERTMLTGMLDWYRDGVLLKVEGLSARHAAATPWPSSTSIAGMIKHLALVEDSWFTERIAGRPTPEPWADVDWDADRDWEFNSARGDDFADVVALYREAVERSRAVTAEHQLDDRNAAGTRDVTLRFALVHLVEETARHLGHLDLLREHLDGRTGE